MSEFKGTKGKWEVKHSESKDAFNVVGTIVGGNYKIARIPYFVTKNIIEINNREKKEAEANAKLIACAPEILDLLCSLENDEKQVPKFIWDKIQQLVKKATE